MVVRSDLLDLRFQALSDPTRRDIYRRAGGRECSVSELARGYSMSFAAVQKHVAILERACLVRKRTCGRERLVSIVPEAVSDLRQALEELEELWRHRVTQMHVLLDETTEETD